MTAEAYERELERARSASNTPSNTPSNTSNGMQVPAPEPEPDLADGWYQVEGGKPYRVNGQAVTDLSALEFDADDEAVVRVDGWKYTIRRQQIRARSTQVRG